ncbi:MAG TPA: hypothetical protein VH540_03875 [Ktedonobacterales bacterium]
MARRPIGAIFSRQPPSPARTFVLATIRQRVAGATRWARASCPRHKSR